MIIMSSLSESAKERLIEELDEIIESQQGVISKDKAFEIWVAENIAGIDASSAVDSASVGGKGDCGVDFYYSDNSNRTISFGQTKWSENFNVLLTDVEVKEYLNGTIGHLENPPKDANRDFLDIAKDFNDIKNLCNIRIYLVIAGKLNQRAQEFLENKEECIPFKEHNVEWIVIQEEELLSTVIVDKTKTITINYESEPISKRDPVTNKNSLIGFVKSKEITNLFKNSENEKTIFLENPRKSLRKTPVNKGILESLDNDDERKKFYKMNNGITACCDKIIVKSDTEFEIDNLKIVNGRQTTYAIKEKSRKNGLIENEVFVELKIHEIQDKNEMRLISKSTNSQNAVKASDLATGAEELQKLNLKFESYNKPKLTWLFEIQRGEYYELSKNDKNKITRKRRLEKEPMARVYRAYNYKPALAISEQEKIIFDTESLQFKEIFEEREVRDFIVPHIFYEALSVLEKNFKQDKQKVKESYLLRQKIVKFYLLSFIHDSLESMKNKDEKIDAVIASYEDLSGKDTLPDELIEIAESAFETFIKPWKDWCKIHGDVDPYDFTNARRNLIKNQDAIDELLEAKHDLERYFNHYRIANAIENFSY